MHKQAIILLAIFLPILGLGQSKLYVDISCSNEYPGVNEQFKLTYTLKVKSEGGMTTFSSSGIKVQPPDFNGFVKKDEAAYNPGFSFGNFDSDLSVMAYDVILQPTKKGKLEIDPVAFLVNGQTHKSDKFTINVGAEVKVPANKGNADMFVTTEVSKREAYVGEPIAVSFLIYLRRGSITEADDFVFPQFSGFWTEEYPEEQNWKERNVNGVKYNVIEVKRNIIFPRSAGEYELEPFEFSATVRVTEGRGWSRQHKNYKWSDKSSSVKIKVKELPSGKPANFLGTYSNLKLNATATPEELEANQAITLKTTFSGSGNLKMLNEIDFDFPKEFEVYDPKINNAVTVGRSAVTGSKTAEYVILVRKQGDYKLESQTFSYFDYNQREYKTLSLPEFNFKVNKGTGSSSGNFAFDGRTDVNVLNQDVRFIKTDASCLKPKSKRFFASVPFYAVNAAPIIAFIGLLFYVRRKDERIKDEDSYRMKKAGKMARKHLKKAAELSKLNDENSFYEELSRATYGYLGDKYGLKTADMNYDKISSLLADKLPEDVRTKLVALLNECDMARYAPQASSSMNDSLLRAQNIIETIEKVSK